MLAYANPAFERHFLRGMPMPATFADIIRHGFHRGFGVKIDSGDVERFLEGVLMRRRRVSHRCLQTDLVDGTWLWITETILHDGTFLTVGTDITSLKLNERLLAQARDAAMHDANTDALTGLPNRRAVIDRFSAEIDAGHAVTVAIIDLDHFKNVNDRFGHEFGDEVLRAFGRFAAAHLPGGMVGRLGGEEFVWIAPGASAEETRRELDKLRTSIAPIAADGGQFMLRYTLSAGVAARIDAEHFTDTLRRADRALYEAKAGGRNCVKVGS